MAVPDPHPHPVHRITVLALALLMLVPAATAGVGTDDGAGDRQGGLYTEPGLEYVAVAPSHLARYLAPLIEWKMDRGVPAQVFNMEQIESTYEGRDDAERLHNFLQDLYNNHTGGTPQWLLLAGDSDQIPVRYLWANRDHSGDTRRERNLYVGDTYYSGLDSDWDTDGDDVFGEPGEEDLLPELYVGRIAASLPEEMEAAVAKILSYELDPPTGDWYDNAFLAGALMDEPNRVDDPYTLPGSGGSSDEGFDPYTDNAYEITQKVRALLGDGYDIIELADYPFFEACKYTLQTDNLNNEAAAAAWARGNAFVFMASHGYEAFGGLAEYQGTGTSGMFESAWPFIYTADTVVNKTGGMLPLVYISSCYSGQFDKADYTNFESMLTVREGGAIALVAGDGDTFRLENISHRSFGNWWLSERFWQLVLKEGLVRPGEALYTLKHEYHTYYLTEGPPPGDRINMDYFYANLYAYNLQGDPEVPVWVGEPSRLRLDVMGGAVFNSLSMRFRVTDADTGEPVEGATVHARGGGLKGLREAVTDVDGIATISPGPAVMGDELRLAVTKDNWVSDRVVVNVAEGVRNIHINDADLTGPASEAFTGATLEFKASVSNTGDFDLSSVVVSFDSGDNFAQDGEGVDARYQTRRVDVPAGEARTLTFLHRYTSPGEYDVIVRLDPDDAIAEASELDNEAIHHLQLRTVPTLPDSYGPVAVEAGTVYWDAIDLDDLVEVPMGSSGVVGFALGQVTEGVEAWIDPDSVLRLRTAADLRGVATIEVHLLSEGELVDTMMVALDVGGVNSPPLLSAVPDQDLMVGEELRIPLEFNDTDGDRVFLSTSIQGATIEDGTLTWTPGSGDVGASYPWVRAVDEHGATTQVRFRLRVDQPNSAPTISDPDVKLRVDEGERTLIVVSAFDAEGDRLTYILTSYVPGYSVNAATGLVTFDSKGLDPGVHRTSLAVTDGKETSFVDLEVTVDGPSSAPTAVLLVAGLLLVGLAALVVAVRR